MISSDKANSAQLARYGHNRSVARSLSYVLVFFVSLSVHASEESLVSQFFGQSGIADKESVYTGEMLEHYLDKPTLGEGLPGGIDIKYRLLEKTEEQSTYAVILTKGDQSQDWYIYFHNDKGVRQISTVRNLALPGLFFMGLQELSVKSQRTNKEEYQYQNMLLTIKSDSELKDYLINNVSVFNKVVELAKTDLSAANELAKTLYLNFVRRDAASGNIDINIGGIIDNSVGYMFVPDGSQPPGLSPDNYIYIEQVEKQWFIYKTT